MSFIGELSKYHKTIRLLTLVIEQVHLPKKDHCIICLENKKSETKKWKEPLNMSGARVKRLIVINDIGIN